MLNYVLSIPFEEPCKYIDRPNKLQKLIMMLLFKFLYIFKGVFCIFTYSNVYPCAHFSEYVGICKKSFLKLENHGI